MPLQHKTPRVSTQASRSVTLQVTSVTPEGLNKTGKPKVSPQIPASPLSPSFLPLSQRKERTEEYLSHSSPSLQKGPAILSSPYKGRQAKTASLLHSYKKRAILDPHSLSFFKNPSALLIQLPKTNPLEVKTAPTLPLWQENLVPHYVNRVFTSLDHSLPLWSQWIYILICLSSLIYALKTNSYRRTRLYLPKNKIPFKPFL
jgi:hypothetical protein